MERFYKSIEKWSGTTCTEEKVQGALSDIMLKPAFHETPERIFIELLCAALDSRKAWQRAFVWLFIFSGFPNGLRLHLSDATPGSVPVSPSAQVYLACECIPQEGSQE